MTPLRPTRLLAIAASGLLVVALSACSNNDKKSGRAVCPEGTWTIVGDQIRTLLGAEIGPNAKTTEVSGRVILTIAPSGATRYEFVDVILGGTSDKGPKRVGVQGSIVGESAFTMNGMSTNLRANTLTFSLDGLPAGNEFTIFASTNLESELTGAATYTCGPKTLTINDTSAGTSLVWSASR